VFPVRYEMNSYILFRINSAFKVLMNIRLPETVNDHQAHITEYFISDKGNNASSCQGQ
jgi:hypothetical protein